MTKLHALFLAAAIAVLPGAALAEGKAAYNGCYVGVIGGHSSVSNKTSLEIDGAPLGLHIDGFSATGLTGGGTVGCDLNLGRIVNAPLVAGIWGDYQFGDRDSSVTLAFGPDSASANFGIKSSWAAGVRVGFMPTNSTLLYGLVGYTEADTNDLSLKVNGSEVGSVSMPKLAGYVFGGGIDVKLNGGFEVGLQYRYTAYDSETIALIPGTLNMHLKPEEHSAMGTIRYRFGN